MFRISPLREKFNIFLYWGDCDFMRKTYWFLTVLIFFVGILVGVAGHMYLGTNTQQGINTPTKENAAKVQVQTDPSGSTLENSSVGSTTEENGSSLNTETSGTAEQESQIAISKTEQEKILSDYKQAIGILFDAWKAKDMPTFRSTIAGAYTGELMETHIKKAESFLANGIGLDVSDIIFDNVEIESADKNSATVNAIYRYTASDYDLAKESPYGEKLQHFVHVRANLVKLDSHWMITGETSIG